MGPKKQATPQKVVDNNILDLDVLKEVERKFKLNGTTYIIKEPGIVSFLEIMEIYKTLYDSSGDDTQVTTLITTNPGEAGKKMGRIIELACPDLPVADVKDLTAAQIQSIFALVVEVITEAQKKMDASGNVETAKEEEKEE